MFGIGTGEMLMIAVVLLLAVGPNKMPGLLKAVVGAYREFRRATRELRAATGIDEVLNDPDLRALNKPLSLEDPKKRVKTPPVQRRTLSQHERDREIPPEGVDVADLQARVDLAAAEEEAKKLAEAGPVMASAEHLPQANGAAHDAAGGE